MKDKLKKENIPYDEVNPFEETIDNVEEYDPDQGERIVNPPYITEEMAQKFFAMFWGREDVYAKRGKNGGYFPQCDNRWDARLCIDTLKLMPRIQNQIRSLAAFDNPEFYKNKRLGYSNYYNFSAVYLGKDVDGYIQVPRGLKERIIEECNKAGIDVDISDQKEKGCPIRVSFKGDLRMQQELAAEKLLTYSDGVLSAATAFGKTVVCSYLIAERKVNSYGMVIMDDFKLSRFGRNAADVLSSLQRMQDFGVNLICVEDGIDSSKDAGKLMISVLSAVAEIERENILVQTMEGRRQKAREGKWKGGFAPYGYQLINGELHIAEDEAEIIRIIYDKFANITMGIAAIATFLNNSGYKKKLRQNNTIEGFSTSFVKYQRK